MTIGTRQKRNNGFISMMSTFLSPRKRRGFMITLLKVFIVLEWSTEFKIIVTFAGPRQDEDGKKDKKRREGKKDGKEGRGGDKGEEKSKKKETEDPHNKNLENPKFNKDYSSCPDTPQNPADRKGMACDFCSQWGFSFRQNSTLVHNLNRHWTGFLRHMNNEIERTDSKNTPSCEQVAFYIETFKLLSSETRQLEKKYDSQKNMKIKTVDYSNAGPAATLCKSMAYSKNCTPFNQRNVDAAKEFLAFVEDKTQKSIEKLAPLTQPILEVLRKRYITCVVKDSNGGKSYGSQSSSQSSSQSNNLAQKYLLTDENKSQADIDAKLAPLWTGLRGTDEKPWADLTYHYLNWMAKDTPRNWHNEAVQYGHKFFDVSHSEMMAVSNSAAGGGGIVQGGGPSGINSSGINSGPIGNSGMQGGGFGMQGGGGIVQGGGGMMPGPSGMMQGGPGMMQGGGLGMPGGPVMPVGQMGNSGFLGAGAPLGAAPGAGNPLGVVPGVAPVLKTIAAANDTTKPGQGATPGQNLDSNRKKNEPIKPPDGENGQSNGENGQNNGGGSGGCCCCFVWFFVIVLLAGGGVGGFFIYKHREKIKEKLKGMYDRYKNRNGANSENSNSDGTSNSNGTLTDTSHGLADGFGGHLTDQQNAEWAAMVNMDGQEWAVDENGEWVQVGGENGEWVLDENGEWQFQGGEGGGEDDENRWVYDEETDEWTYQSEPATQATVKNGDGTAKNGDVNKNDESSADKKNASADKKNADKKNIDNTTPVSFDQKTDQTDKLKNKTASVSSKTAESDKKKVETADSKKSTAKDNAAVAKPTKTYSTDDKKETAKMPKTTSAGGKKEDTKPDVAKSPSLLGMDLLPPLPDLPDLGRATSFPGLINNTANEKKDPPPTAAAKNTSPGPATAAKKTSPGPTTAAKKATNSNTAKKTTNTAKKKDSSDSSDSSSDSDKDVKAKNAKSQNRKSKNEKSKDAKSRGAKGKDKEDGLAQQITEGFTWGRASIKNLVGW